MGIKIIKAGLLTTIQDMGRFGYQETGMSVSGVMDTRSASLANILVGNDENGISRYAHCRGTADQFRMDVTGSDKSYGFCYRGKGTELYVFEAPIVVLALLTSPQW